MINYKLNSSQPGFLSTSPAATTVRLQQQQIQNFGFAFLKIAGRVSAPLMKEKPRGTQNTECCLGMCCRIS